MNPPTTILLLVLSWLDRFASAAPPASRLNAGLLAISTFNLTSISPGTWVSKSTTDRFPPYPPPNPLYYRVPNSNVEIKFHPWQRDLSRDERQVEDVLDIVDRDAIGQEPTSTMAIRTYEWGNGAILLEFEPKRVDDPALMIKWSLWSVALIGIRGFVEAYPGVDFQFELFVDVPGAHEDVYVGIGQLLMPLAGA